MSRKHWTAGVVGIVAAIILAGLPLAALAAQDTTPAWAGTYVGVVQGDSGGDTGETVCTIWIEALDAKTARISIQVPGLPVLSSTGAVAGSATGSKGYLEIWPKFGGPGVDVDTQVRLFFENGRWQIRGSGSGRAFGLDGGGSVAALQSSTGIAIPSFLDQLRGTANALLGSPDLPPGFTEKMAGGRLADSPLQVEDSATRSPLEVSEPRPPLSLGDMLAIDMGFDVIFLIIGIV